MTKNNGGAILNDDGKIIAEYDTDNVLWQILEKDFLHYFDMTKEEWSNIVYVNQSFH